MGATIFFGVDDDLELHGLQNAKKLLEDKPPIILGYGLYWVNEGKKEEKVKSKRR